MKLYHYQCVDIATSSLLSILYCSVMPDPTKFTVDLVNFTININFSIFPIDCWP